MKKLLAFAFVSALFLNACVRGTETFERKPAEKSYAIEDIKTTAEDEFPKWIGMWQSMIPDFDVSQMTGSDEEDMTYSFELTYKNGLPDFFVKYVPFSPDKTKYVLIANPEFFEEEEGMLVFNGGEPDVYVNVVDTEKDTITQVLQCGTPCTFDHAAWLDNNAFLVAGSSENSEMEKIPSIWFFDLGRSKMRTFSGPAGVPYEEFGENHDSLELLLGE